MAKPVMVIGGGIAGIQAAFDLGEMGVPVYLVESSPSLGGRMAQLDKTFPTNDCSTCILAPKISDCYNHEMVTTYTYSNVLDIQGKEGDFRVRIRKNPRYIIEDACTGCGECIEKCPVKVLDEYNEGLVKRKGIYKYYDQGVPNVVTIDPEHCLKINKDRCGICEKVCDKRAVDYNQKPEEMELSVAAVIYAAGYEAFQGEMVSEYGYLRHPNVITSLEYERYLSASGPTEGHIQRVSDGEEAKKIAFLHCAGSRDTRTDCNYCSAVCCMYSIKQALVTREHSEEIEAIDLYYMDIRAYGKGFERYYNTAEATKGVNFRRSRVARVEEDPETGQIIVKGLDAEGRFSEEKYDLVVLGVGLKPNTQVTEMMKKLKIRVNKYGFAATDELDPLATSCKGIFTCGVAGGPKDIPESVIEASGAAAQAAIIARSFPELKKEKEEKEEVSYRFVDNERVRIGVFVCHCGNNIGGVVDVPRVTEKAEHLPFVEHSEEIKYLCSPDNLELIGERIKEKNLNRVVVASCTPRTHETLFRQSVSWGGLNPYLMVMTNIRDQNSWVHREEKEKATSKAFDLIKGAVAKAKKTRALERSRVDKLNKGFVIGGGVAGMTAALQLADIGFPVVLVEREGELGGNANNLLFTPEGRPASRFVNQLRERVLHNDLIETFTGYSVSKVDGYVGNFKVTLDPETEGAGQRKEIEGGVVIVATGAGELQTDEYLSGKHDRVISQLQLEEKIRDKKLSSEKKKVFMIQCVGSREEPREYCSRLCCNQAVSNAVYLKERYPEMDITILYRDIRTYGFYEDNYRRARQLGVKFVRFDVEEKPQVEEKNGKLTISYRDPVAKVAREENADLLVLSKAVVSRENSDVLSKQLKVPLNEDGFFLEAHVKLMPVDFATDGVYLCGLAHGPKNLTESISQARAAAGRAAVVLTREYLLTEAMVAQIDPDLCMSCRNCVEVCPYQAIDISEWTGKAEVNKILCKGCGSCASVCRPHAADLHGFSNQELVEEMEAIFADREPAPLKGEGL